MTLQEASSKLREIYLDYSNISCIGITDKEIVIYLKKKPKGKNTPKVPFPELFDGFPVRITVTGGMELL